MMPEKWKEIRLGDFIELKNGINYNKDNFGLGIPVINVRNFKENFYPIYEGLDEISSDFKIPKGNFLQHKDILFVRSNGNKSLIGRTMYILNPPKNLSHSGFTIRLRIVSEKINSDYLIYLLKTSLIRKTFSNFGNGTNISNLNQGILSNLKLKIPTPSIQKKIARILSNYDKLIGNNNERIELLEQEVKLIYDQWFVKFKFPGWEKIKFVDSGHEFGKIPKDWEISTLDKLSGNIVLGGTPARKKEEYWGGEIPWIKSGKLNELRVLDTNEKITKLGLDKSATKLMPKRTVLIAITGAILISLSEINLCANQSVIGLYGFNELGQEYLYLSQMSNIKKYILKMSGSAQQHINKEIIQDSEIIVPEKSILNKFKNIMSPMFDEISNLLFKNKILKETRDMLLSKLISGKINISELDIN